MNYFVFGLLFHNKWNNINKYSDKYRGQIVTNRMVKKNKNKMLRLKIHKS